MSEPPRMPPPYRYPMPPLYPPFKMDKSTTPPMPVPQPPHNFPPAEKRPDEGFDRRLPPHMMYPSYPPQYMYMPPPSFSHYPRYPPIPSNNNNGQNNRNRERNGPYPPMPSMPPMHHHLMPPNNPMPRFNMGKFQYESALETLPKKPQIQQISHKKSEKVTEVPAIIPSRVQKQQFEIKQPNPPKNIITQSVATKKLPPKNVKTKKLPQKRYKQTSTRKQMSQKSSQREEKKQINLNQEPFSFVKKIRKQIKIETPHSLRETRRKKCIPDQIFSNIMKERDHRDLAIKIGKQHQAQIPAAFLNQHEYFLKQMLIKKESLLSRIVTI